MVNQIKLLDKMHSKKYIYLLSQFAQRQIAVDAFESSFLQIRREDTYWLSGLFKRNLGEILDTLFLDVSDYTSNDLYDPSDPININEDELRKRANKALIEIQKTVG